MSGTSDAADKQTTVEEGTEFKGTMTSNCPVMVRGALDGQISAPALTVAETGTVVGKVEARSIRSEGTLAGSVDAEDIYLSGSVRSDTVIRASTLEVKLKRDRGKLEVTFGDCILEVGDEPSAEAVKEPTREPAADAPQAAEAQAEAGPQFGGSSLAEAAEAIANQAATAGGDGSKGKKGKKAQDDKSARSDGASEDKPNGKSPSIPPPA